MAAGLVGAVSGGCVLAFFLVRQGLSRASLWSTVLGLPLALIGTAATVWVLVDTVRPSRDSAPEQQHPDPAITSTVSGSPDEQVDMALAREKVPEEFSGREAELEQLAAFSGDQGAYMWWQGPPWAGKTALAAYFTLHPPPKVHVVSFIADSIPGGATAKAFHLAMIRQLTLLANAPARPAGRSTVERRDQFLGLLEQAASVVARRGEQLVVLADGLDEDNSERPRIVDFLPRRPPEGVKVIVSSRPGLDLPPDHPLASPSCPRIGLAPSARAQDLRRRAREELRTHLGKPERRPLLGLMAATGGGLTARDLAELTEENVHDITARLRPFARSLELVSRDGEDVYRFAHDELGKTAEQALSGDMTEHRERIHQWYESHQASGWAADPPPGYLLWRYWEHLRMRADLGRLAAVSKDGTRHDRMLQHGGSDAAAIEEVATTLQLLADQHDPDLTTLAVLVFERERLASRNHAMPENLPAVWTRLGQTTRAQDLARSIPDVLHRVEALTMLAEAVAPNDSALAALALEDAEHAAREAPGRDFDRAEKARKLIRDAKRAVTDRTSLIWASPEPEWERSDQIGRDWFGCDAVRIQHRLAALAAAMETIRMERLDEFCAIMSHEGCAGVLVAQAQASASNDPNQAAGYITAAELVLGASTAAPDMQNLVASVKAMADQTPAGSGQSAGEPREHAAETARAVTKPLLRAIVLVAQARIVASADPARAFALVEEAQKIVRRADEPDDYQAVTLAGMAVALADALPEPAAHLAQQARELAAGIYEAGVVRLRPVAQACVAAVLAGTHKDVASDLAAEAVKDANAIEDREDEKYPVPLGRPVISASVAAILADIDPDLAAKLADEAARSAGAAARPSTRAYVLAGVADAFTGVFPDQARELAEEAERTARTVRECGFREPVLARMAWALAQAGTGRADGTPALRDWENTNIGHEGYAFEGLAEGLAAAHQWDAAEHAARAADIALQVFKGIAQSKVAATMAEAGLCDRAEEIAKSCGMYRPRVLASIASALATTDPGKSAEKAQDAVQAAREYEESWFKPRVFLDTAQALVGADPYQAAGLADEVYQVLMADRARGTYIRGVDSGHHWEGVRSEYMARIARVLALAGRWDRAQSIAREIEALNERAEAFADIATAAFMAKRSDEFGTAVKSIPAGWTGLYARIWASAAGVLATAERELAVKLADDATRLAQATTNPAQVLIWTAEALHKSLALQTGPDHPLRQRARRMLSLALAKGGYEWIEVMRVLGKLAPEAVSAFYDKLVAQGRRSPAVGPRNGP